MKRVAARELRRYRQFYMVYPQIWQSATAEFRNMLPLKEDMQRFLEENIRDTSKS
jgi:hypothetical protein